MTEPCQIDPWSADGAESPGLTPGGARPATPGGSRRRHQKNLITLSGEGGDDGSHWVMDVKPVPGWCWASVFHTSPAPARCWQLPPGGHTGSSRATHHVITWAPIARLDTMRSRDLHSTSASHGHWKPSLASLSRGLAVLQGLQGGRGDSPQMK